MRRKVPLRTAIDRGLAALDTARRALAVTTEANREAIRSTIHELKARVEHDFYEWADRLGKRGPWR